MRKFALSAGLLASAATALTPVYARSIDESRTEIAFSFALGDVDTGTFDDARLGVNFVRETYTDYDEAAVSLRASKLNLVDFHFAESSEKQTLNLLGTPVMKNGEFQTNFLEELTQQQQFWVGIGGVIFVGGIVCVAAGCLEDDDSSYSPPPPPPPS
ncbi:MAG: hypothetical protein ACKVRO_06590 [Micropepsaceae bacterium]